MGLNQLDHWTSCKLSYEIELLQLELNRAIKREYGNVFVIKSCALIQKLDIMNQGKKFSEKLNYSLPGIEVLMSTELI